MKKIGNLFLFFLAAALLFSCGKKNDDVNVIDIAHHYKMVYMLGGAVSHWDSSDPVPMKATADPDVFEYELDLVRSTENKLIKFSVSVNTWDKTDFLVPVAVEKDQAYSFLKEGVNQLSLTSVAKDGEGNLRDYFFGIDKGQSGKYKIKVNPIKMTLEATKISSLPDPDIIEWIEGNVYMVGDATPAGWDISNPTPMLRNGDIHTYDGQLSAGEMKFPTKFDWSSPTYRPAVDKTEISKLGIQDETVILQAGDPDNKWTVKDAGRYQLTLDAKNLTLKVKWLGE
jgi:hypothetical protein